MKSKIKRKFVPKDYEVIHQRLQSLRQKDLDIRAYIEEFHRLCIRSRMVELDSVKVVRYLSSLRYNI